MRERWGAKGGRVREGEDIYRVDKGKGRERYGGQIDKEREREGEKGGQRERAIGAERDGVGQKERREGYGEGEGG